MKYRIPLEPERRAGTSANGGPLPEPCWLHVVPDAIPARLRGRNQWVVWRGERRDGRTTKVPYQVAHPSRHAAVSDPTTWGTFDDAVRVQGSASRQLAGVGYVLTREDGLVGIDLDHCRDRKTGTIAPWALAIVRRIDSYTEVSPSGTGLRIFARGVLPPEGRRKGLIEMYDGGRYLTLTGHRISGDGDLT